MNLSPLPIQKFFANNGRPLDGGLLFTYEAGTSTKVATYNDASGLTQNTNPIVLDFRGECHLWLDIDQSYKFVLCPRGASDPPTNPIWTADNITAPLSLQDLTPQNIPGQIIGEILWPRSSVEAAAGITPSTLIYPYGDPRRAPTFYVANGWTDYGDVPTRIDATHFSVPGNLTARYYPFTQIAIISALTTSYMRVQNSSFAAGITTVVATGADMAGHTVPTSPLAVWVAQNPSTRTPGCITVDANTHTGLVVTNVNQGSLAASRLVVFQTDAGGTANSALSMVAAGPNYNNPVFGGAFLNLGFTSGGRGIIYTPPSYSLEIGTSDIARVRFPAGNTAIAFTSDVTVENAWNPSSIFNANGTTDGRYNMSVGSTLKGYVLGNASEIQIGSSSGVSIPLSFIYGGNRAIQINGTTTTGASTPTLSANKPGANAGVIAWQPVLTSAGVQGYIPVFGA